MRRRRTAGWASSAGAWEEAVWAFDAALEVTSDPTETARYGGRMEHSRLPDGAADDTE